METIELTPVGELLTLKYILLSQAVLWERNPKKHDIAKLIKALRKYGFQKPPKFSQALNNGEGGLVYGNGRTVALRDMQAHGDAPPDGIALDEHGEWLVPVWFGNDLDSQAIAEAFAIDHNNLTISSGNFSPVFTAQMYKDKEYVEVLTASIKADVAPVTVRPLDLSILVNVLFNSGHTEWERATTAITLGRYSFDVPHKDFAVWSSDLVQKFEGNQEAIALELQQRLGLMEFMN